MLRGCPYPTKPIRRDEFEDGEAVTSNTLPSADHIAEIQILERICGSWLEDLTHWTEPKDKGIAASSTSLTTLVERLGSNDGGTSKRGGGDRMGGRHDEEVFG